MLRSTCQFNFLLGCRFIRLEQSVQCLAITQEYISSSCDLSYCATCSSTHVGCWLSHVRFMKSPVQVFRQAGTCRYSRTKIRTCKQSNMRTYIRLYAHTYIQYTYTRTHVRTLPCRNTKCHHGTREPWPVSRKEVVQETDSKTLVPLGFTTSRKLSPSTDRNRLTHKR